MKPAATCHRITPGTAKIFCVVLAVVAWTDCRPAPREPVALRYFYSWFEDKPEVRTRFQRFTQETGTRVNNIPVPENSREYVELAQGLLKEGGVDVLNIDLIWSAVLEPELLDLRPYLTDEIPLLEPQLLNSYTVNGKLIAVPFNVPLGTLEYRTDLLSRYGFDHPPRTWDELESMAERIQKGERSRGIKDFWGYVWQGVAGEAMACNALEWQASAGGGRIIEQDRTISVNNPAALASWQRARRWVGWISPPSVVAYRELDSVSVFNAGRAAFNRIWFLTSMTRTGQARHLGWPNAPPPSTAGFARMPAGTTGSASTLGGTGTAIARRSPHVKEAIEFLRFQLRVLMDTNGQSSGHVQYADPPSISPTNRSPAGVSRAAIIVARPSIETGSRYKEVSGAYIDAVHSVLTGENPAPAAGLALEKRLIDITGLAARPPAQAVR